MNHDINGHDEINQHDGAGRLPTGVPGLDAIMHGGFLPGAVFIVRGTPGAGKTILANQMCFNHAQSGGRALFVTLLSESHSRMREHMEQLSFYDASAIPERLYYISGFSTLEEGGLGALMDMLRREIRTHRATLLILDGLIAVEETSTSDREFRKFIYEFQAHVAAADCTALLLTNGSRADHQPEHTMVDGLITLSDTAVNKHKQRELEVLKFRGSSALRGRHPFRITDAGIVVYPRIEALLALPSRVDQASSHKMSVGVPMLDDMLNGGIPEGTSTLLLGASGTGKTSLALHFLSQSTAAEPGLIFGFYETPERLVLNASTLGLDLKGMVDRGDVEIIWRPVTEQILDDLAGTLMDAVRRRGVKRLVIDGLNGFQESSDIRDRVLHVCSALASELKALGVTMILTSETRNIVGPGIEMPFNGISSVVENVLVLRFVEHRARIYRLLSILKVRGSGFDSSLREFHISGDGIELLDTFEGASSILTGFVTEAKAGQTPPPGPPEVSR